MYVGMKPNLLCRRRILAGSTAILLGRFRAESATANTGSLGDLAWTKGRLFGTACLERHITSDPTYVALLTRECRIIVAQNDLKWMALRPAADRFDFSRADAVVAFAERIGARMRGHTLVWHDALPQWCSEQLNARTARPLLAEHITTVCRRYRGRIHSWDVVNEAVEPEDGRSDGLRETPWLRALGPNYVGEAFKMAAAADPSAMLVYNEYGICDAGRKPQAKRAAVLHLLDQLVVTQAPVGALGMQGHLNTGMSFDERELRKFLDEVAVRGFRLIITELDVLDKNTDQDGRVADTYARFLNIVLPHPATIACLTWGLSDRYSWLRSAWPKLADEMIRPLPFDESYRPKPARDAIAGVLASLQKRRTER